MMADDANRQSSGGTPRGEGDGGKPSAAGRRFALLSLGALGIVFGDIGTSPLYAFRESFHGHRLLATSENVLGVLSLIIWALIIVIALKYVVFVLRADNRGEGGIMALTALVTPLNARRGGGRWFLIMLGLFGTALLYGDGMITPAISVLSAVEGLGVATPLFEPFIIPVTVVILIALFLIQRRGTGGVGRVFGPVMLLWFLTIAVLGIRQIVGDPSVLAAVNPVHAVRFFVDNGLRGWLVLGSVFLAVTGGEALYADIGHFGKNPIRLSWFTVVLPCLVLNYLGQGALVLMAPSNSENPFYRMVPTWALYPVVILATLATVIASQALISGVFSLTRQAVQLGYSPRTTIVHTSTEEIGQVYVPAVNWALMLACILLVLGFRSSANLAAAYGVGVSTDMVFTTILLTVVMLEKWRWRWPMVALVAGPFLLVDLAFFGGNIVKVPYGGWVPLVVAAFMFTLMSTWKRGRLLVARRLEPSRVSMQTFLARLDNDKPHRVPGTNIYMSGSSNTVPVALLKNYEHNKIIHETVLFVAVETEEIPRVARADRIRTFPLGSGFHQVVLHYGFTQSPNVPRALSHLTLDGKPVDVSNATYVLGRDTILPSRKPGMALWREWLFAFMSRNAQSATAFYVLPPDRVVELGTQVEI